MTVTTTLSTKQYSGNGSTTVFAFPYKIIDGAHFVVSTLISATNVMTIHTKDGSGTYDYTVAVAADLESANVTFSTAPPTGYEITIDRQTTKTQPTDYTPNDDFPAETHERALDRATLLHQDLNNDYKNNAIRFDPNTADQGGVTIIKTVAQRQNKIISFDGSGDISVTQEIGTSRGNWATATAYFVRDIVIDTVSSVYICKTAHTSSGSSPISTNTDAAKWDIIINGSAASTSATAAATSATAAATSATAAATSATASATSATSSATSATASATSATSASTSASSASSSATSATASATDATGAVGAVAWKYTFSTSTTMSDPGTGEIRFDNATLASVTNIAIDATSADTGNPDVSDLIASIDDGTNSTHEGYIFVRKHGTPATFMAYNVTGAIVDSTGWLQIPVTHASSGGTLSNADILYISFSRSGNVGATGLTGATGSTGPTGPTGPAGDASIGDIIALG